MSAHKTNTVALYCQCSSSAPFSGHANAVIVTPSPLKADVVPNTGVVIASHLGGVRLFSAPSVSFSRFHFILTPHRVLKLLSNQYRTEMVSYKVTKGHIVIVAVLCLIYSLVCSFRVSQAPGFHVVSQMQKSPQPIVPKHKSCSSGSENQEASSSAGESSLYSTKVNRDDQPTTP